jgi:hypothetical protein
LLPATSLGLLLHQGSGCDSTAVWTSCQQRRLQMRARQLANGTHTKDWVNSGTCSSTHVEAASLSLQPSLSQQVGVELGGDLNRPCDTARTNDRRTDGRTNDRTNDRTDGRTDAPPLVCVTLDLNGILSGVSTAPRQAHGASRSPTAYNRRQQQLSGRASCKKATLDRLSTPRKHASTPGSAAGGSRRKDRARRSKGAPSATGARRSKGAPPATDSPRRHPSKSAQHGLSRTSQKSRTARTPVQHQPRGPPKPSPTLRVASFSSPQLPSSHAKSQQHFDVACLEDEMSRITTAVDHEMMPNSTRTPTSTRSRRESPRDESLREEILASQLQRVLDAHFGPKQPSPHSGNLDQEQRRQASAAQLKSPQRRQRQRHLVL